MDPVTAVSIGFLVGEYCYHRLFDHPDKPVPARELQIPMVADGTTIPLIFGMCRVRAPILAWTGEVEAHPDPGGSTGILNDIFQTGNNLDSSQYWQGAPFLYAGEFFFVLGIPFKNGVNKIHSIYIGEDRISDGPHTLIIATYYRLSQLDGEGDFEESRHPCFVSSHYQLAVDKGSAYEYGGLVEFFNGNTTQALIDPVSLSPTTVAGQRMIESTTGNNIPGYRGFMSVFLGGPTTRWYIGSDPQMKAHSFEASSYPEISLAQAESFIGLEANPVDVIFAILTDTFAKLGLAGTRIDQTSFIRAAITLYNEGDGYSRSIESANTAEDTIFDILRQIDGVLFEDPDTGLIKIKLIRADFDPATVPLVTPSNCESITNLSAGGWVGITNKIRVNYTDRTRDYQSNSITAQNMANAVGQDGEVRELVIEYPGICTQANAAKHASRELAANSRPIMKMRVTVDRSFWSYNLGDPLAVNWPEYNISGRIFRIARRGIGTTDTNSIVFDLVEDYFFLHRSVFNDSSGLPTHPGPVG